MPIDALRLEECLAAVRAARCDDVLLRGRFGDLRFLSDIPGLRRLHVGEMDRETDVSAVGELTKLESLFTANSPHAFDLSRLTRLRKLTYSVKSGTNPPGSDAELEVVGLIHGSPTSGDLERIPAWKRVRELHVALGSLRSLEGVERMPSLEYVRVSRLPKLVDIQALARLPALRKLSIEDCGHALDLESIAALTRLEELVIHARAQIPSLTFLTSLPKLQRVGLGRVDVADGDLSPLRAIRDVDIHPFRRHYRPRDDEFRMHVQWKLRIGYFR